MKGVPFLSKMAYKGVRGLTSGGGGGPSCIKRFWVTPTSSPPGVLQTGADSNQSIDSIFAMISEM